MKRICSSPDGWVGALLGDLGSGKTTILQKVQYDLLREYLDAPSTSVVPILISLSRYKHHGGHFHSLLQETLSQSGITTYPQLLIDDLAKAGRLVFFFDGLDEVHPLSNVDDVLSTAIRLLDYVGAGSRAIISSRTHLFRSSDEELAIFGEYERDRMRSLAQHLRQKLSSHPRTSIAYVQPFSKPQIDSYLRVACGDKFNALQRYIDSMYGFSDMAQTPVLLAMMRHTLPDMVAEGHRFGGYPQIELYEQYLARWIKRDEGRAQLSSVQRERLSKVLARRLISQDDSSATWDEIREMLKSDPAWSENPIGDGPAEMDVRNSTFLIREGREDFRFVHRSIMEFLAAKDGFDRLVAGDPYEKPRTNGQANFLALLVAREWMSEGTRSPIP